MSMCCYILSTCGLHLPGYLQVLPVGEGLRDEHVLLHPLHLTLQQLHLSQKRSNEFVCKYLINRTLVSWVNTKENEETKSEKE